MMNMTKGKNNEVYLYLNEWMERPRKVCNIYIFNNKTGKIIDNYINRIKNIKFEGLEIHCYLFNTIRLTGSTTQDIFTCCHKEKNVIVGRDIYVEERRKHILDNLIKNNENINKNENNVKIIKNQIKGDLNILEKTKIINKIDSIIDKSNVEMFVKFLNVVEKGCC